MYNEIYLDANATSPVMEAAVAAATRAMREGFGNPSSTHATGLRARSMLAGVRAQAKRVLGAGEGDVFFTSGATEGIQTAVLSALCAVRDKRLRGEYAGELLVYGATEHKAVPESLAHWNRLLGTSLELAVLPVDANGQHRLDVLRDLAPRAAMVCTMAANNETGAVSDLNGITAALRGSPAYWMVDSVQALGKLALNLAATAIDYAPFSGHKLYAPKGVGMLYVRAGAPFTPLMCGGGQESGLRAGTENMAGVAALGAVLGALEDGTQFRAHEELEQFRDRLAAALRAALPGIVFNCSFEHALSTTLNFSVEGMTSKTLLDLFDAAGIRVSSGSACSSAKAAPSYVLQAMQLPMWRCSAAVRMSFGPMADAAFIDAACQRIARCGEALRGRAATTRCDGGIVQFTADGHCAWLVTEGTECVVIDALPALADRIAGFIDERGYTLRAQLSTNGAQLDGGLQLTLADGRIVDAMRLGARQLARVEHAQGTSYLLGSCTAHGVMESASVAFAFTGCAAAPCGLIGEHTIVCASRDHGPLPCTSLSAAGDACAATRELDRAGLQQFLATHPDAVLVDVREPCEHAAGLVQRDGVQNVPLSQLAGRLGDWLREPHPLIFFCRSGARSARAVECLQRLGHADAWHLAGGMALNDFTVEEVA